MTAKRTPRGRPTAVFDLDGTLMHTSRVDGECFVNALRETFEIENVTDDWHSYTNVTDSGIIEEIVSARRGSGPTSDEIERFVESFVRHLKRAYDASPGGFDEIAGARAFVQDLLATQWNIAIATGGWRASATLKLSYGGFQPEGMTMATANDGHTRVDIVKAALRRLGIEADSTNIILFGDGLWDVEAALQLKLPIIAVGPDTTGMKLVERGAAAYISDYANGDEILERMETILFG